MSSMKRITAAAACSLIATSAVAQTAYDSVYYMDGKYAISWAYNAINLSTARSLGLTGKGISVAVFDTGVDVNNPKLQGNLLQGWNIYGNGGKGEYQVTKDNGNHGTFVSGIIAANMTLLPNMTTYGIAPDAKIMPIQIFDEQGQGRWTDSQFYTALNYAMIGVTRTPIAGTNRGGIFNNSWNSNLTLADLGNNTAWINSTYRMSLYGWNLAAQRNILNVWAAGNYGKSDPGYFATMPSVDPRLLNSWIVVVATDRTGHLASFSNACGIAAAYCMAAPGQNILGIYTNPSGVNTLATGSGTSFAAPMVSGAAALLWQYYPYLKASDIQKILFTTADKSGVYSNTAIYGHGMLDLTRAFQPVGTLRVATGSTVTGTSTTINGSFIGTTGSLAGSITAALSNVDLMLLDDFNRHYHVNLGKAVGIRRDNQWGDQLAMFGAVQYRTGDSESIVGNKDGRSASFTSMSIGTNRVSVGDNISPSLAFGSFAAGSIRGSDLVLLNSVGNPYMNMAPNSNSYAMSHDWGGGNFTRIGAFTNTFPRDELNLNQVELPKMAGALAEQGMRWDGGYVSMSLGFVSENGTVLGMRSGGQLDIGQGAKTLFSSFNAGIDLPKGWSTFVGANLGYTVPDIAGNALVTGVKHMISGNAYAGLVKTGVFGENDRFGLTVGMPMSLGYGLISMRLPTDRDFDGNVTFQDRTIRLRPSQMEFSTQAFYDAGISDNQTIGFGVGARFNTADIADSDRELIAMARYRLRF
jgi:hypothetical protein